MPPRHGKSETTSWAFPVWALMLWPHKKIILASYEAEFAASWGRKVRNTLEELRRQKLFGFGIADDSRAANAWVTTRGGGMITAGVGGAITGRGGDILIVDDPVKNAEEAESLTFRERNWNWWLSTAYSRLEPGGMAVQIQTRWHQDDLMGRTLARSGEPWQLISFPAVALEADALGRAPGEALWPERYPVDRLAVIQREEGPYRWGALYQQNPIPAEGSMFNRADFPIVEQPTRAGVLVRVRAWDLAASVTDAAKRTAGALLSIANEGMGNLEHMVCGQWGPGDRDNVIVQTAKADPPGTMIVIEQEPGSGGIAQIETLKRRLFGFAVEGVKATGDKATRAAPLASAARMHQIAVTRGEWNTPFFDEAESFPGGTYLDQVDAAAHAYNKIAIWLESQHIEFGKPEESGWEVARPELDPPEDPLAAYRPRRL